MKTLWENRDFENYFNELSKEKKLLRRQIRYACFRIQKFVVEGKPEIEPEHQKLREEIQSLPGFGGWDKFAVSWDVADPDPITLVKRKFSIEQEWNAVLQNVVPEIKSNSQIKAEKIEKEKSLSIETENGKTKIKVNQVNIKK